MPFDQNPLVKIVYGGYEFAPKPTLSYSRSRVRDAGQNALYDEITISAEGVLYNDSGDGLFSTVDTQQFKALNDALSEDYRELVITHASGFFSATDDIFGGAGISGVFPRVDGFTIDNNTWTHLLRYSFSWVYNTAPTGSGVESFSDSWSWSENDNDTVEVSHSVDAKGLRTDETGADNSLENAKDFVVGRLGLSNIPVGFPAKVFELYTSSDYIRRLYQESVDKAAGSYSVTENFVLASGLSLDFIHRNTFDYSRDQTGIGTISVQGNIQGDGETALERSANSTSAWLNTVRPSLFDDANSVYTSLGGTRDLASAFQSESVTKNPSAGTIDYSAEFSDRLNDPAASGIVDATFSVSDQLPVRQFASIMVPGRLIGPVIQDLNTVNEGTYTLSGQVIGETIERAKAYAQTLINSYGGQTKGNFSRITSMNVDPDTQARSISFSVTWSYIGDQAVSVIP